MGTAKNDLNRQWQDRLITELAAYVSDQDIAWILESTCDQVVAAAMRLEISLRTDISGEQRSLSIIKLYLNVQYGDLDPHRDYDSHKIMVTPPPQFFVDKYDPMMDAYTLSRRLHTHPKIRWLLGFVEGVCKHTLMLTTPSFLGGMAAPYQALWRDICQRSFYTNSSDMHEKYVYSVLRELSDNVETFEQLAWVESFVLRNTSQRHVVDQVLINTHNAQSYERRIDEVLATLSQKRRTYVQLRYGIGTDHAHTFREIAELHGVTASRAGQVVAQALEEMRCPKHLMHINEGYQSVSDLRNECQDLQRRLHDLERKHTALRDAAQKVGVRSMHPKVYDTYLHGYDGLGIRAQNALNSAGITYMGQLVALTELQLYRGIHGIGRKTYREITDHLSHIGLSLGTDTLGWQPPPEVDVEE